MVSAVSAVETVSGLAPRWAKEEIRTGTGTLVVTGTLRDGLVFGSTTDNVVTNLFSVDHRGR
jgi:hypothetical protein